MNFIKSLKLSILVLFLVFLVIFPGCGGITTPGIPQDSLNAVIAASSTSGKAPLEVIFDASKSSAAQGNEIVSYEWDFEDGKTGEGRIVHHGFDSPGNYTVILTISDNKGAVDTSSVIIRVSQPTETVIEQNFDTQNGTEFDTGTGLKIIIPPTSIEGQMNLEVRYDSSPSQSASDLMNLHSSYSISIIPQKGFQEKELMKSGIKKDQETVKVSFIFDVPEDVDPQSLAIFEWTDEGWCLAGVGDIETIEQLGGVLSFDGTQISIEIPNFSNYSKYLNSRDSRYDNTMLLDITLSTGNFNSTDPFLIEDTDTSRCPMESETIETIDSGDHIKKVYFQSLDFGIVGYSTGIPYKVGVNNSENLIGKPNWNQPSTGLYTDIYQILGLSGWYLMPSDDDTEKGVLTLQFGPEGGNCTVWLKADGGMLFGEWLLSAIPGVSISSTMADTIRMYIEDAGNYLMGDSVDTNILVEKTKKMVIELVKEGIKLHPVGLLLTSAVKLGELKARVEIYLKMTRGPHNPCPHYKSPGYWEWKIVVPPITPKTYTITASSDSHGSINPSGDVTVNQGSDKLFTITPDTGYSINDVLVDGSSVGAVSSYTFTNVTQDHTISATFSKVSQPDLVITDLCIEPDPPVLGDYYNLELRFENKGDEDILENFSINIYFDNEYIDKYDREGLDNGVYCVIKSLNFSRWPSDTNLHIIKAVIDPNNIINESNENNNQYSIQIRATESAVGIIMEEFNGSSIGDSYGIVYTNTINGQGAVFSRIKESRIEYPFSMGFPHEGTIEYLIKVYHGYRYSDYVLNDNSDCARIFDTGIQDVWYPGAMWIDVCDNGRINLGTATTYGQPEYHNLEATGTDFAFNEWHTIGISFGSQGQYIMLDGNIIAANTSYTESLQTCGNFTSAVNIPTVGELVSCFWVNNRHDAGFEGVIDRFRVSEKQKDWYLSKASPSQY